MTPELEDDCSLVVAGIDIIKSATEYQPEEWDRIFGCQPSRRLPAGSAACSGLDRPAEARPRRVALAGVRRDCPICLFEMACRVVASLSPAVLRA